MTSTRATTTHRHRKIVIVGGGIGGLAAALALRHGGHEVVVLERRPPVEEAGAGISLWPNAVRVLRELGLGPALDAAAVSDGQATIRTWRGKRLSSSDMAAIEARFAAPLSVLHRRELLEILRAALGAHALGLGMACWGVVQDGATASAVLADGTAVEGDAVVIADGIGSRLREAVTGPVEPRDSGLV